MHRFARGAAFASVLALISIPAGAAPLPGDSAKGPRTPAPAFPIPDETALRSTPRATRAPVSKGQLPPGFVFPADGSLSDVVRALNELRAYDEGGRGPAAEPPLRATPPVKPRATEAEQPPRALRLKPLQAVAPPLVPARPLTPARPVAPAPTATQETETKQPESNYVYRSYRTRSGARVVELVERPTGGGIELLSNVPQRPPRVKTEYQDVPAGRSAVAEPPRAFLLP